MRSAHVLIAGGIATTLATFLGVSVALAAPQPPVLQSATGVSSCGVELSWNQPDEADYFRFSVNGSGWTRVKDANGVDVSGPGDHTFIQELLVPGTNYQYQLQACANVGGCSATSTPRSGATPAIATSPATPTSIRVERWEADGARVALGWTPKVQPAESGFRVFRSDNAGVSFSAVNTLSISDFASLGSVWKDPVSTDSEHRYRIKTYQTAKYCMPVDGTTAETENYVKFSGNSTPLVIPARPAAVSVVASQNNGTRIRFGWTDVESEQIYTFQVSDTPNFNSPSTITQTYNTNVTQSSFVDLTADQTFYYRVRACAGDGINIVGCSEYRADSFVSGRAGPRNVTATLIALGDADGEVNVAWEDPAEYRHATRISRRVAGVGSFTQLAEFSPTCVGSPPSCTYRVAYTDRPLRGARYEYQVVFAETGTGTLSDVAVSPPVSLKFTDVLGWAWSSTGLGEGMGWFRVAYDAIASAWGDATEPVESRPYGVLADEDAGILSGYAWNPYAGWLSFQETSGCPLGGTNCGATFNPATGAVSGWAKLIGANQWVSLSSKSGEPAYGLTYGVTSWSGTDKVFMGQAWGGDGVGWIAFGDNLPAPQNLNLVPSETEVRVEWENPVGYQSVKIGISKENKPNDPKDTFDLIDTGAISAGNHSEVVSSLTSDTDYGFFVRGSSVADSGIVTTHTLAPGQASGYTFICRATSATSTLLSWVGPTEGVSGLKLFKGNSSSTISQFATRNAGGGSLTDAVPANTTRYYQLEVDYQTGPDVRVPSDGPISCTTLAAIPQDPNVLQVTPLGPTSLYVTWKDNATRAHNFVLERIKVTPATSINVSGVRSASGNSISLTWQNPTNAQTYRSPYYHVVERSTDSNFTTITSFPIAFGGDMDYNAAVGAYGSGARTNYDFTDTAARSGTIYYYRVKACSLLKVDYNGDGVLDDVCSTPTPANGGSGIATVPAPRAASLFGAVKDAAAKAMERVGDFFGRLAARVGAVTLAPLADGAQVDLNKYFSQFAPTLTFATNPGVYRDDGRDPITGQVIGLEPDTVYLYRTKTCYLNVNGTTNLNDCTSYTNEGAGKTLTSAATSFINVNVCVRSNLCGPVSGLSGGSGNAPVNQCSRNADCRNVGTTRQFFEETPR